MLAPSTSTGQDALALAVDREHAGVGQQVDDGLGEHERDPGRDQHRQEDRAAVDQQQDDQDDADRREQQVGVDALERRREVGELPARAGDVARQAVDLGGLGDVLDDAGQRLERGVVAGQRQRRPAPPRRPRSGSSGDAGPATPSTVVDPPRPPRRPRRGRPRSARRCRSQTSSAGMSCAPANPVSSASDFVDSAESGRNAAWSFSMTLLSLPRQRAGDRRDDEEAEQDHGRQQHPPPVDAAVPARRWGGARVAGACRWLDQPVVAHVVLLLCVEAAVGGSAANAL